LSFSSFISSVNSLLHQPDAVKPPDTVVPMDLEHHFDETHLSLMERKSWKNRDGRRLPKRFRDLLPEPSTLAPPAPSASTLSSSSHASEPSNVTGHHAVTTGIRRAACRINEFFTTQRNKFNLFRRYTTGSPPSHDPEDDAMTDDLCEDHDEAGRSDPSPAHLYPFPMRNSLLLGDWYWNGGAQKSQTSFKDLLDIVGDPDFNPTDVRHTKWDTINRVLADGRNWVDEDAGWEKTTISISVPFQSRRGASDSTGTPKEFLFTDFYHRNLVSVIKEKLSNARDNNQFHYDPYELNFQPDGSPRPIRVHGELYTSPAFLDEHKNCLRNLVVRYHDALSELCSALIPPNLRHSVTRRYGHYICSLVMNRSTDAANRRVTCETMLHISIE
jgi:hypothetical protein